MADITSVATAIATAIGGTVEYCPELTVGNITATAKKVVVPKGVEVTMSARGRREETLSIQVAVVQKATPANVSSAVSALQSLGAGFVGVKYGNAVCTAVSFPTIYGGAELREKRIFVGVIELTLKGE